MSSRDPLVMGLNNESFEPVLPLDDVLSPEVETVWGTRGGSSEYEVMIGGRGKRQGNFLWRGLYGKYQLEHILKLWPQ